LMCDIWVWIIWLQISPHHSSQWLY